MSKIKNMLTFIFLLLCEYLIIANQNLHIANQIGNWLAISANQFFHNKLFTEFSESPGELVTQ